MPIQFFEDKKVFLLQGKETTYAFRVHKDGYICNLHWGRKVTEPSDLPTLLELTHRRSLNNWHMPAMELLEYRSWGGPSLKEPAMKITFADGTRMVCTYENGKIVGRGEKHYPDGSVYKGDLSPTGLCHGKGVLILPDGKCLECMFEKDTYVDPETGQTITLP